MTCPRSARASHLQRSALALALALPAVAGCATGAPIDRAGDADRVAAALAKSAPVAARPMNRAGRPLAYLALGGAAGERLAALDLDSSQVLWTVRTKITGRLAAGASVVIHGDGADVVAHDIANGRELWRRPSPAGQSLVGYAMDGDAAYIVTRKGRELRGGEAELVAMDAAAGRVRWRRAIATANLGAPAARGGLVAVPNQSQFVSLYDGGTGGLLADALAKDQAATFVRAFPEGLFYGFGPEGAFLLSRATAAATRATPGHLHANLPRFVTAIYDNDAYRTELIGYSAMDRNKILWRADVEASGKPAFRDGMVCVVDYRFFFAFDAKSGELRWVYDHPLVEAVSAAHEGASILFATSGGEIVALDPRTGRKLYEHRLPAEVITGATFDAEGFAPAAGAGAAAEPPALAATLSAILWDPDRRYDGVKAFAVDEIAQIPGRAVTGDLLKLLGFGRERPPGALDVPPAVIARASVALGQRKDRDAADLIVAAIRPHADFVDGTRTANLDVLARVAASLGAPEAAAPLAEHLARPETDPASVGAIARALVTLRAPETLPALRDYLSLYRADSAYEDDPAALLAVIDALVALGGAPERELLLYVAEEPRTLAPVREHARRVLAKTGDKTAEKTGATTAVRASGKPGAPKP